MIAKTVLERLLARSDEVHLCGETLTLSVPDWDRAVAVLEAGLSLARDSSPIQMVDLQVRAIQATAACDEETARTLFLIDRADESRLATASMRLCGMPIDVADDTVGQDTKVGQDTNLDPLP